jgi:hypothetical protein
LLSSSFFNACRVKSNRYELKETVEALVPRVGEFRWVLDKSIPTSWRSPRDADKSHWRSFSGGVLACRSFRRSLMIDSRSGGNGDMAAQNRDELRSL